MSSLKHRLFAAGFAATSALRADRWLRPLAQGCGAILMFHHVRPWRERAFAPNRLLEITPEFLDRALAIAVELGFDLVPLDEVPLRLRRPGRPFAAITFDDGYRDTAEHALPVLRRHRAPFTVFVTTRFADGAGGLWWLELEEAIARLDRVAVSVGGACFEAACATPDEKAAAFERLYWLLRDRRASDRRSRDRSRRARHATVPRLGGAARSYGGAGRDDRGPHPVPSDACEMAGRNRRPGDRREQGLDRGEARGAGPPLRLPGRRPDLRRTEGVRPLRKSGLRHRRDDAAGPSLSSARDALARAAADLRQRLVPARGCFARDALRRAVPGLEQRPQAQRRVRSSLSVRAGATCRRASSG